MTRAAVGVAAAVALLLPAVASATTAHDADLARRGITLAVKRHWVKPGDAARYRDTVSRAVRDTRTLPKLRGAVVASQLSQLTPLWDSYTAPRALTLFTQLEANTGYLETHRVPTTALDITDEDGVVYRWFPRLGFEFHPLANFGSLNNLAAKGDAGATQTLADALVARAIPRGSRLIWEYLFRFGSGRPPWASGMAQAVAAQSLERSAALLGDTALDTAAARAYASVAPLLLSLPSGPWIRLYGFESSVVLNAQLQTIVSLLDYSRTSSNGQAAALAARLLTSAETLLPRFDTGEWSRYSLGGAYASRSYEKFVTDLLAKLAAVSDDPFWIDAADRFHAYLYSPPQISQPTPTPTIWPQPADGYLDSAAIQISLSQRASVTLAVAKTVTTYRLSAGSHTLTWKPPAGLAQGTYPVQVSAVTYAGNRATVSLAPLVVRWDTAPPPVTASVQGTALSWQSTDLGTPWLALTVAFVDPAGANPPLTLDLGHQPLGGSTVLAIPPGTWQATLQATNSAGLTTALPLGTVVQPG